MKNKASLSRYTARYTLVFLLCAASVFLYFLISGTGFVWLEDGAGQYIPYMAYTGKYLREFFGGLLSGSFSHRMFDFSIGLGSDVQTILRTRPLDFLSVFVPVSGTESLYYALFLLRLYLGGLSFSAYCFRMRKPQGAVLAASMMYVFSGYTLKLGTEHPAFEVPVILLPLLFLGIENALEGCGFLLLAFTVFLGFTSNYYFMYMMAAAAVVYVLLRLPDLYPGRFFKGFLQAASRLLPPCLLGTGMAMATLLPTIRSLQGSERFALQSSPGGLLLYRDPVRRLYRTLLDLVSPYRSPGSATFLNYLPPLLPALALVLLRPGRKNRALRAGLVLQLVMLQIPAAGFIMAGLSNVNNRWVFILSFCAAFAVTAVWEDLPALPRSGRLAVYALTGAYVLLAVYDHAAHYNPYALVSSVLLVPCAALFTCRGSALTRIRGGLLTALCVVSCLVWGIMTYHPRWGGEAGDYLPAGTALQRIFDGPLAPLSSIPEDGFWRADTSRSIVFHENDPLLLDYCGTSMNNSLLTPSMAKMFLETESPSMDGLLRIYGMGGSYAAEELAGVRYFLVGGDRGANAPYGYTRNHALSGGDYSIYENPDPLGIGFCYRQLLPREEYDTLSAPEKQQAMLRAAVVDEVPENCDLPAAQAASFRLEHEALSLPEEGSGVVKEEGGYVSLRSGASLVLDWTKKAGTEACLRLCGLHMDTQHTLLTVSCEGRTVPVTLRGDDELYTNGQKDFSVWIGSFSGDGPSTITLTIHGEGSFHLEEAQIWYAPTDGYAGQVSLLKTGAPSGIVFGINTVSGTLPDEGERLAVFSIPWSGGWKAYVDGERVPLVQAGAYMGIVCGEGSHTFTLRYTSPGSAAGSAAALLCHLIFLILLLRSRVCARARSCSKDNRSR